MATLFSIVMLSHQISGFLGAWLGGKVFTMTGSYDTHLDHRHRPRDWCGADPYADREAPLALKVQAA